MGLVLAIGLLGSNASKAASAPVPAEMAAPGAEAARTLSQITGMAISPLLGTSGIGAYKYFKTDAAHRAELPWYAQPRFWIPALILVSLCAVKDASGTLVPGVLKKPLDALELFENKVSGVLATGAVLPLALKTFHAMSPGSAATQSFGGHYAAMDLSWLANLTLAPIALLVYGAVWMVSHTIQVLILLSPSGILDAALKSFRTAILASVVGSHWMNPTVGAIWSGIIALLCLFLAGWAFRLTVFGTIFAADFLTFRSRRFLPSKTSNLAFVAVPMGGAPRRSLGRLSKNPAGELSFEWRPWLLFAPRSLTLPATDCWLGDGAFHNDIHQNLPGGGHPIFILPPRCNGHEKQMATIYGLTEVRPVGLKAVGVWLRSLFTVIPAR